MIDVAGIHGIGQQQGGRNQLLATWQVAMNDGVERAKGRDWPKPSMDLVYYGDFFLDPSDNKGTTSTLPDFDADMLDFLERLQEEIVDPNEPVDLEAASKGMTRLPTPVAGLASWLERRFGVASKLLFFGDLTQVRRYQRDDSLAKGVLDRTREIIAASPRLLIGHSLGSIVAYEALCLLPNHGVRTLMTVGSPLGLRSIREALRRDARQQIPYLPPGVVRWVNIYDKRDPVALAGGLARHWPDVADETVDNGDQPHSINRYLGKKVSGSAIVAGLTP